MICFTLNTPYLDQLSSPVQGDFASSGVYESIFRSWNVSIGTKIDQEIAGIVRSSKNKTICFEYPVKDQNYVKDYLSDYIGTSVDIFTYSTYVHIRII